MTMLTSVRTLGPVKMLVLRGHHFHRFLDRVPDFKRRLKMIQEVRCPASLVQASLLTFACLGTADIMTYPSLRLRLCIRCARMR